MIMRIGTPQETIETDIRSEKVKFIGKRSTMFLLEIIGKKDSRPEEQPIEHGDIIIKITILYMSPTLEDTKPGNVTILPRIIEYSMLSVLNLTKTLVKF
jgi:hypothetical protein